MQSNQCSLAFCSKNKNPLSFQAQTVTSTWLKTELGRRQRQRNITIRGRTGFYDFILVNKASFRSKASLLLLSCLPCLISGFANTSRNICKAEATEGLWQAGVESETLLHSPSADRNSLGQSCLFCKPRKRRGRADT